MSKIILQGCGTALVTPFKNGEVDYEAYAELVDRQVKAGVHFLVPLATTGETPTLSDEEKIKLLCLTREHSAGKPLVVGCGSNSLNGTLKNIELLKPFGVDAWLVVVPFYNKPTQEGQYEYFKAVAQSTDIPIVIYNVPGRTGANMAASTAVKLAKEVPSIIGIKEASGKFNQVAEIVKDAPEDFSVLSGDDDMTIAFMAAGAKGVISVASNAAPAEVAALTEAILEGNLAKARNLHFSLMPLFTNCFVESNPIPVKAALNYLGLCSCEMRLPLSEATTSTKALMEKTLNDLKG